MSFHFWRRKKRDAELDEEVRSHLRMAERDRMERGETLKDAASAARREFGNVTLVKETSRGMWGWKSLDRVWQDIRFGFRLLRRSPGFTVFAVLTLALGIGANTAIFSVVNGVLLRPLPFRDPTRLVAVLETKPSQGLDWLYATGINVKEWQRRQLVFENMAGSTGCGFRLADPTEPHLINGDCVSAGFFEMLGVKPALGRFWTPEEDIPGRDRVAVISYDLWQRQFGGDQSVIGKTIWRTIDKEVFTVIGVLPEGFQFINDDTSVWAPLALPDDGATLRFHQYFVFARLKPGVSVAEAEASMVGLASQLERELPKTNTGWGATVRPLQKFFTDQNNARSSLIVLLGAVGLLLLIACANIANLLLARATGRQREIAVRMALGASRLRLLRQLLTESLLLGIGGGAAGFILARATFAWLIANIPPLPSFQPHSIRLDTPVLVFAMVTSILASVLFGLTPALRASRLELNETLRQAGRGLHGTVRDRISRQVLVVGEIALAVVLLIGTGLLVESLRNLQNDRLGFTADHVLTVPFCCLDAGKYSTQSQVSTFYRQAFERLSAIPGVESVAATNTLPMRQFDGGGSLFAIQGRPAPEPGHETITDWRIVGPDYFRMMQIQMVRGRTFNSLDDENHVPVALINETMAQRHFPGMDPIGQQIQIVNAQPPGRWYTIVGIATNSRDRGLGRDTRSTLYICDIQVVTLSRGAIFLLRTRSDPRTVAGAALEGVRSLNHDVSMGNVRTLEDALALSLAPQRFSAALLTLFAVLALCLASIGVYGVTSYSVLQRTHEIGVRIALGARSRDVLLLIVGQGFRLALSGVIIGIAGALALTRFTAGLLFGVSAHDPVTLTAVCGILTGITLLACFVPARRATRVDPMVALRHE